MRPMSPFCSHFIRLGFAILLIASWAQPRCLGQGPAALHLPDQASDKPLPVPNEWLLPYKPGDTADRDQRVRAIKDKHPDVELDASRSNPRIGLCVLVRKPQAGVQALSAEMVTTQMRAVTSEVNKNAAANDVSVPLPSQNHIVHIPPPPRVIEPEQAAARRRISALAVRASTSTSEVLPDAEAYQDSLWALPEIHAPSAWSVVTSVPDSIPVAVLDTGISLTHPNLQANIHPKQILIDSKGVVVAGGKPEDDHGHGSHVAGIIGAIGRKAGSPGAAQRVVGVDWTVKMLPVKFLDNKGFADIYSAVTAIDNACQSGARVVNMSWGMASANRSDFSSVETLIKLNPQVLFVAAAGNGAMGQPGTDNDKNPVFPASFNDLPNVVSVLSVDRFNKRSAFSNFGKKSVDIGAPGGAGTDKPDDIYSTYKDGGYAWDAGTSMSAAYVSGAAALVMAQKPALTGEDVKKILTDKKNIKSVAGLECSTEGVLDLAFFNPTATNPTAPDPSTPVASPGNTNVTTTINGSKPGATVTTNVTAPPGVNVSVTVNIEINGVKNVVLGELDLPYSQPSAFVPLNPTSPYIPQYSPVWPPPGSGVVVLSPVYFNAMPSYPAFPQVFVGRRGLFRR
jgi:subtilisin family serine protease